MQLLGFLLLPIVLTVGRHVESKNYALTINDDTLKEIRVIGKSPDDLDLSNLSLRSIDEGAFSYLSNLKTLNLANNSIAQLPRLVFANLANLEELNLANNALQEGNSFAGLANLKTLNISNNPLTYVEAGNFFGIPRSANILTQGIDLENISPSMFEDPSTIVVIPSSVELRRQESPATRNKNDDRTNHPRFKVCIQDGHLKSLEEWKTGETLTEDCRKPTSTSDGIELDRMGIKTFENGWYRLQGQKFKALSLGHNEIVNITRQMLNDLPEEISMVSLAGNKIERLERGIMERANPIEMLDLSENLISEIEDGALENVNITNLLFLDKNRLSSTKFVKTLPSKIRYMSLTDNDIAEIEKGSFRNMNELLTLILESNPLKRLENGALVGLPKNTESRVSLNLPIEIIQGGLFDDV